MDGDRFAMAWIYTCEDFVNNFRADKTATLQPSSILRGYIQTYLQVCVQISEETTFSMVICISGSIDINEPIKVNCINSHVLTKTRAHHIRFNEKFS